MNFSPILSWARLMNNETLSVNEPPASLIALNWWVYGPLLALAICLIAVIAWMIQRILHRIYSMFFDVESEEESNGESTPPSRVIQSLCEYHSDHIESMDPRPVDCPQPSSQPHNTQGQTQPKRPLQSCIRPNFSPRPNSRGARCAYHPQSERVTEVKNLNWPQESDV